MFRNFIFDWSGTLVDDLGPVVEATNVVIGKYGLPPFDREGFRQRFRLPYREFYAEILPHVPLDELEAHFRPAFDGAEAVVTLLPHAREKLDWCRRKGIRCFVCTSMDSDAFAKQMHDFGLADHFEATYSGILDKREVIGRIIDTHRLAVRETAFIGDMVHDIETAQHGRVAAIAVLTGYQDAATLSAVRPDLTVPDLGVLRELLDRRREERPVATVGALIHDGAGRVLMVRTHKWSDLWGIPGGKIRRGEGSEAALVREVREETGLAIGDIRFAMAQDCIDSPEFMRPAHFILLNYVARATSSEVTLNDEAEEFRWLVPADATKLPLNQPTRSLLEHALANQLLP